MIVLSIWRLSAIRFRRKDDENEAYRPESGSRRTEGWITAAVCLAVVAALGVLTVRFDWPRWIFTLTVVLAAAIAVLELAVLPGLKYRSWRYAVAEKDVELHHGI